MTTDSLSSMRSAMGLLSEGLHADHEQHASTIPAQTTPLQSLLINPWHRTAEECRPNPLELPAPMAASALDEPKAAVYEESDGFRATKNTRPGCISPTSISPIIDPLSQFTVYLTNFAVALRSSVQPKLALDKVYVVISGNSTRSSAFHSRLAKTKPVIPVRVGEMYCARWIGAGWIFPIRPLPTPVTVSDDGVRAPMGSDSFLEVEVKISRSFVPDESLGKAIIDLGSAPRKRLTQCRVEFDGGYFTATLRVSPKFMPVSFPSEVSPSFSFGAPRRWYDRWFPCLPLRMIRQKPRGPLRAEKQIVVNTKTVEPCTGFPVYPEWKLEN